MNKRQERSIFFAILCCCCLTIIVVLLIAIPAGYYIYETYFICLGEPPSTPGLLSDWDGLKRYSGLIVKYRCNMENSYEVVQIVDCVNGEWKIVMKKSGLCSVDAEAGKSKIVMKNSGLCSVDTEAGKGKHDEANSLNCQDDPPKVPGMTRVWDGNSRAIGTTVEYRCEKDPEQDRVVLMVCTEFVWKTTYQKSDSCDELLQLRRCVKDPWPTTERLASDWDNKTRDVGTQIRFFCSSAPNSPVMRTVMCSRDYHWHMISDTKEKCLCGHPLYYPQPLHYDWDGKSLHAGVEIKYYCNTALGKTNFMTLLCSANADWIVTHKGVCTYLIDRPLNFTESISFCNQLDSDFMFPRNDSDLDHVKSMLKEEKSFDLACNHKAFIGLRENIGKQWLLDTPDEEYLSTTSDLWTVLDEGREHCAAMQHSANWKLNNVLCTGVRYCAVCEINATNPSVAANPMLVCPKFQKTCYLGIFTHKGDYALNKKECESMGGKLAAPTSSRVLEEMIKAVKINASFESECQWAFVGLVNDKRHYETPEGKAIEYGSFVHDRVRSMARHCVVIHEKNQFKYVDEHCTLKTCFMCTIKGSPVGSTVLSHVNRLSALNAERELEASLQSRSFIDRPKCKAGWVTDGMGCFLFNGTKVTESEARATCRSHFADLASLNIPVDRQFISYHLIRHFSGTDNLLWFVEITGDFEMEDGKEIEADYETNCTVVQFLPKFGWRFMDCTSKAAFICHN